MVETTEYSKRRVPSTGAVCMCESPAVDAQFSLQLERRTTQSCMSRRAPKHGRSCVIVKRTVQKAWSAWLLAYTPHGMFDSGRTAASTKYGGEARDSLQSVPLQPEGVFDEYVCRFASARRAVAAMARDRSGHRRFRGIKRSQD